MKANKNSTCEKNIMDQEGNKLFQIKTYKKITNITINKILKEDDLKKIILNLKSLAHKLWESPCLPCHLHYTANN